MTIGFFTVAGRDSVHYQLAESLVRSIRTTMPSVPIVQFTDIDSPAVPHVDTVMRRAPAPMGLLRIAHQASVEGDWLFLDTDVVVQRDVRHVFDHPFDVAVASREGTYKHEREAASRFMARMPFNFGVVFARCPAFWRSVQVHLETLSPARQHFMGEQEALCAVIQSGAYAVHTLPPGYNYPPRRRTEDLRGQSIVHYKGSRKAWLLDQLRRATVEA